MARPSPSATRATSTPSPRPVATRHPAHPGRVLRVRTRSGATTASRSPSPRDRYGNFDVFVMPATGGEATRLTFHSTGEIPSPFTADDKAVLFSAYRQELATNAQFPIGVMTQLYSVPAAGGRVTMVLPVPAVNATARPGRQQADLRGRQGLRERVAEARTPRASRVTSGCTTWRRSSTASSPTFAGEDRNPVFDDDGNGFYYLSEQSGSFNVFKSSLTNPAQHSRGHPLHPESGALPDPRKQRHALLRLRRRDLHPGPGRASRRRSPFASPKTAAHAIDKIVPVNDGFTEATLSPNGKEFAYVFRGEIFVTSIEGGVTKRITNTPWQERSVRFTPDGRSLVYAVERDSSWDVYDQRRSSGRKSRTSTRPPCSRKSPSSRRRPRNTSPAFSPDGKEVAYLENRVVLKVVNLASKQTRTIMTRRAQLLVRRRRPVLHVVARRQVVPRRSSGSTTGSSHPRSAWSRPTATASSTTSPIAATTTTSPSGCSTARR